MPVIGHGVEICTYATRPSNPTLGTIIYQTDTDEYLKYVNYGGADRWMQADVKPNRCININGSMGVWQRGTSFNGNTVLYTADRWQFSPYGGSGSVTISQQTASPPAGFRYFMRLAATGTTTTNMFLCQSLETADVIRTQNKQVTLSFWYKNNVNPTNTFNANILYSTATDGNLMIPNTATSIAAISLPNSVSWTFISLTGTVPSNATSLAIRFDAINNTILGAGIDLTGIQLEVGSAPSEFEFEPYDTTLRKCQRYYYMVKNATGNNPALFRTNSPSLGNLYHCNFSLPVVPRITTGISSFIFASGTQIHKPGVRWDTANSISFEAMPGGSTNYQMWVTPGVDDGSSYYVCYLYGVGIVYNGEL